MRRRDVLAGLGAIGIGGRLGAERTIVPNVLTAAEARSGFELLFDGRTLQGWTSAGNWAVQDHALHRVRGGGGVTRDAAELPDEFDLRFAWKVAPGGNSGVYYRPGQVEYQVLDNQDHPDGRNPLTSAASLYSVVAPEADVCRPGGRWNEGRIVFRAARIEHWLNSKRVVVIDRDDPRRAAELERMRQQGTEVFGRGGQLHFQDHGDPVWYRSIRLQRL